MLTEKGQRLLAYLTKRHGAKKGKGLFYTMVNAGKNKEMEPKHGT